MENMTNEELLPCPFCGGSVFMFYNYENKSYEIECTKCGCHIQQHYARKDKAIEAWERRAANG